METERVQRRILVYNSLIHILYHHLKDSIRLVFRRKIVEYETPSLLPIYIYWDLIPSLDDRPRVSSLYGEDRLPPTNLSFLYRTSKIQIKWNDRDGSFAQHSTTPRLIYLRLPD